MDERRYELATLAAARRLRSSYCSLAHGKVLADRFYAPVEVAGIARGDVSALDQVDIAVMELAEKIVADATSVTAADIERLRELGLSDDEIVDVALAAAARCFFSKTLDASASSRTRNISSSTATCAALSPSAARSPVRRRRERLATICRREGGTTSRRSAVR